MMKKFDGKFLLVQVVIVLVISAIVGIIVAVAMGADNPISGGLNLLPFFFFVVAFAYCMFANSFTGHIANKTMEQHSEEEKFEDYSTFVTDGSFTLGAIVRIDERTGRVAYVSYQNPYEFQMVQAKDLTNIKSSYIKGPLGGTNYVYFEFYYNNKKVRIPTFTANNAYSLQSEEVLEGISKADAFCDLLTNAQNVAA